MSNQKNFYVRLPEGPAIRVTRQRGQLIVCATGCCCGRVENGFSPVPTDLYHQEWERRKLRNKVHLSQGGCLGPCELGNVVTLIFDRRITGFHSINDSDLIFTIFDHLEALLASDDASTVKLPPELQERTYDYFL